MIYYICVCLKINNNYVVYVLNLLSLTDLIRQLRQDKVIIYPTEAVFGLGCDPDSKIAVNFLLSIKRRSWKKGLILIAANYTQLLKYIDDSDLNDYQKSKIFSTWPGPVTWVFPARVQTPFWLTGKFSSIAVRVSHFEPVRRLCLSFGKPLVSTSANLTGFPPIRTFQEIYNQLGPYNIPMMSGDILGLLRPSEIKDAVTGRIIRN